MSLLKDIFSIFSINQGGKSIYKLITYDAQCGMLISILLSSICNYGNTCLDRVYLVTGLLLDIGRLLTR